jgi:hypothetical protein
MSFAFNPPHRPAPDEDFNFASLEVGLPSGDSDVGEHWLDEALRSVALPEGFLSRMAKLAQRVEVSDKDSRFCGRQR